MIRKWNRWMLALVLFLLGRMAAAQPAFLAADVNTVQPYVPEPQFLSYDFAVLGTDLFFLADDGIHGIELWKTDGTAAGTAMVKDVCPGSCWGRSFELTVADGVLYFQADDGAHGYELWRSDGSPDGTFLVKDILPGRKGHISALREMGGLLLFTANDGAHGSEPWVTDGTAAGTRMLVDLQPGPYGSNPQLRLAVNGGFLFNANDGVHGMEPWLTDGTAAGTRMLRDIRPVGGSSDSPDLGPFEPDAVALPNGSFLFVAEDETHGAELWLSNGTEAGTALVADLNPGPQGSYPYGLTLLGNTVFFTAYEPTAGWELWKTDGTGAGTTLFKDLNPSSSSYPQEMNALGGRLFFRAEDGTHGSELWTSDGTVAGTVLVKDVNPGSGNGLTYGTLNVFPEIGGAVLFFADDGVHGLELWKTDGTEAGTVLMKDLLPGTSSTPFPWFWAPFKALGSHLYFYASGPDGLELWKTDGSEAGTSQVRDIATLTSSMRVFLGSLIGTTSALGGSFVFPADDGTSGIEPWRTDGTLTGTQQIADLRPGFEGSLPDGAAHLGNRLLIAADGLWSTDGTTAGTTQLLGSTADVYSLAPFLGTALFSASDAAGDQELWKTDGTLAGTVRVKDIHPGASSAPNEIVPLGSSALFAADDGSHGRELWVTNGTAAGTVLLKDLVPGVLSSYPSWLTKVGGQILFFVSGYANRQDLWKSDGTAAGTAFVKNVDPYFPSSIAHQSPAAIGTTLFFLAHDDASGTELWKSDGTAAGTVLVKDILPGARSSHLELLTRVRDRLFFVAEDGVHGRELWVSDGTEAGTRMVKDAVPGEGSSRPGGLAAVGHVLLFSAYDDVHGVELWVSDGTEAGTRLLQDIAPGDLPSSPVAFTLAWDKVGFAANDGVAGLEPWTFPRQVLGSTYTDVPPGHWAWLFVETLADAGIATECAAGLYCPGSQLTRAQVAVFLGSAAHFEGYVPPPATGTRFEDVPASHPAAAWIEQLARDGLTQGCSLNPPLFCPASFVSRAEMAVFLLRARHGLLYFPPPATGTRFEDVSASYWAAPWIEQLAAEGLTAGCTSTRFCPTNRVTRAEIAVFLTRAFGWTP
ncbi:MAG TPA: ELWxxDGT repeat protein [Thermoanaerobaculia bacterium]|nr:ELWxxDGT repeat protein [Thermoanaerobaculia bacterium]